MSRETQAGHGPRGIDACGGSSGVLTWRRGTIGLGAECAQGSALLRPLSVEVVQTRFLPSQVEASAC